MQINQYVIEPMEKNTCNDPTTWNNADFYRVSEKIDNELFWVSDHIDFYEAVRCVAVLLFRERRKAT